jgi:hypothetical protein
MSIFDVNILYKLFKVFVLASSLTWWHCLSISFCGSNTHLIFLAENCALRASPPFVKGSMLVYGHLWAQ